MYKECVAFIHAKGNSSRVPGKNLRKLGGIPLFLHAAFAARLAVNIDEVVVDSDSQEILDIAKKEGFSILKRPGYLATNETTGDDLMFWQASNRPDSLVTCQVIPTSPFITPASIDEAVGIVKLGEHNSAAGVHKETVYLWKDGMPAYYVDGRIPNSQNLESIVYETTGLYAHYTPSIHRHSTRIMKDDVGPVYLSAIESIDINTEEDFKFAEIVYAGMLARGETNG